MRLAGAFLALAAWPAFAEPMPVLAPDAPYEVIGLSESAVLVTSMGQAFRCDLDATRDGFQMGACTAIVPGPRMAAAALERQALEQALGAARDRAEAAEQERDALRAELEALRAVSPADLEALRQAAALRPTVIALERAAEDVGAVDDARVNVFARIALLLLAEKWGDGCTLEQSAFAPENERAQQQVVMGRVLEELGISAELAGLMIANLTPDDTDPALAHNRVQAALQDALKAGDVETYDRGTAALRLARRNLEALGDRIGQRIMAGDLIVMAEDRSSLRVAVPPCGP